MVINATNDEGQEVDGFEVFINNAPESLENDNKTLKRKFFYSDVLTIKVTKVNFTDEIKNYTIQDVAENKVLFDLSILKVCAKVLAMSKL